MFTIAPHKNAVIALRRYTLSFHGSVSRALRLTFLFGLVTGISRAFLKTRMSTTASASAIRRSASSPSISRPAPLNASATADIKRFITAIAMPLTIETSAKYGTRTLWVTCDICHTLYPGIISAATELAVITPIASSVSRARLAKGKSGITPIKAMLIR